MHTRAFAHAHTCTHTLSHTLSHTDNTQVETFCEFLVLHPKLFRFAVELTGVLVEGGLKRIINAAHAVKIARIYCQQVEPASIFVSKRRLHT